MDGWPDREFFENQRLLADHEGYLQGLRVVPIGALLSFEAVTEAAGWRVGDWAVIALVAVAFGLFFAIQAAYRRIHGEPQLAGPPSSSAKAREIGLISLVCVAACGAVVADVLVGFGVSLTGLAMSAMVALCWWSWGTFRWHYAVMSAAIFALSFAPLFGLTEPAMLVGSPLQYGVLGFVMGVGGILDHAMLMRMRTAARLGGGANG